MRKLLQTKTIDQGKTGNCYPTVLACLLGLDIDQVPNFETLYELSNPDGLWNDVKFYWLDHKGYEEVHSDEELIQFHNAISKCDVSVKESGKRFPQFKDQYYMVVGDSPRRTEENPVTHICIYRNGKLFHDPHPSGDGLLNEQTFIYLNKLSDNGK